MLSFCMAEKMVQVKKNVICFYDQISLLILCVIQILPIYQVQLLIMFFCLLNVILLFLILHDLFTY